jgi:hypothetical protein
MLTEPGKHLLEAVEGDRVASARGKEGRARPGRHWQTLARLVVRTDRRGQRGADGNEPRLEELRVPDGEDALVEIHIAAPQAQALARPQSCSVEDQQQRPEGHVLQRQAAVLQGRRRIKEALQLVAGVDVGLEGTRDAWRRLRQRRSGQVPASHEVGEEAAQGLVLPLPPPRRRPDTTTECVGGLTIDVVEGDVAESSSKRTQNARVRREDRSHRTLQRDVGVGGLSERHARPPRSSKATRRSEIRSALA